MVLSVKSISPSQAAFWQDAAAVAAGEFPGDLERVAGLEGHVLFETSGSTGGPKWLALSKQALLASASAVNEHLGVDRDACWGLALPLRHVGGFGVAARAWRAGCRFAEFGRRWDAGSFRVWLAEEGVSHSSLVPTQVHDLVVERLRAPDSLKAVVVGGGWLDAAAGQAARELGWPVLASYGMTETASQIATQAPEELSQIYQPSPLPVLPLWRVELTDDGRLRIDGDALFSGWVERHSGEWGFRRRENVWFETNDRVRLESGGLIPLGRADGLIKVLGELVDPGAIERELIAISGGSLRPDSLVVVAVEDARAGHALVPVADAAVVNPDAVRKAMDLYQKSAPGFRRLGELVVMEEFPRSGLGKPLRARIAEAVARK